MLTIIGRWEDPKRFEQAEGVDTWLRSGRIPKPGDPPVVWLENRLWLDERIARGDAFGIATDPASLPEVIGGFVPGRPDGYFTARELKHLRSHGIEPASHWLRP
ncbi:MAG: hypothetical protein M3552_20400 [Planctomycetota bacterium]|nr:hypothetical protein [Planctomycetaceae bacterium]MDQ3332979.1 hypothetical protein [Planctomycetota bacterium]